MLFVVVVDPPVCFVKKRHTRLLNGLVSNVLAMEWIY